MRTLYLNKTGHRWVNVDNKGRRERVLVWDGDKASTRAIHYVEAIGNFAVAFIRVKGKRVTLREIGTVADCGGVKPSLRNTLYTFMPREETQGKKFGHITIE